MDDIYIFNEQHGQHPNDWTTLITSIQSIEQHLLYQDDSLSNIDYIQLIY